MSTLWKKEWTDTDAEVLAFVRGNPGAVGYVRPGINLGTGVKQLQTTDR